MSKRTVGGREKETIYGGTDAGEEFVPPEAAALLRWNSFQGKGNEQKIQWFNKNIRCFIDVDPYLVKKSNCPFVIETALD